MMVTYVAPLSKSGLHTSYATSYAANCVQAAHELPQEQAMLHNIALHCVA